MTVHSGKFAVVNGASAVRNWSINETNALARAINSATKGGSARRPGVRAWTGSYAQHRPQPAAMPGEIFTFQGFTAPDDDTSGAGVTKTGSAIVDSLVITWNWQSGDIIQAVTNFSGHLALTTDSGTYSDATIPDFASMCGVVIHADDYPIDNVQQATLTISAANQPYVNSSTDCWTGRKAGPIDFNVALQIQDNEFPFATGDDVILNMFVDGTDYWRLKWAQVKEFTNLTVDREGAIITYTANLEMNISKGGVFGEIVKPGGVTPWFPPAP